MATFSIYLFFSISFLLCYFLINKKTAFSNSLTSFGRYLNINAFPSLTTCEHKKFAILRVLFGLIVLARGIAIVYFLLPSEYFTAVGYWSFLELLAGMCIALGLMTQWALLFLILLMWQIGDFYVLKSTLGNDIAAMTSLLLLLTNAGKFISIDAILINRYSTARTRLLYYAGQPSKEQIALAKFAALLSYWAVCMYSIAMHLNEPAWTSGVAGPLLLTNNFMSQSYEFFTSIFLTHEYAIIASKISLWLMMFWYPMILPFVLMGGLPRAYIIVWGWLFLAFSRFVLQLGYLPEIEVVLWLGLFWSKLGMTQSISVFYDDRCNLCDKTIQIITFLDVFGVVKLKPLSLNQQLLSQYGISEQDALRDLYGVSESGPKICHGYDFYILLARSLFLLWPLVPFLYVGKLCKLGPLAYRYIADRRRQLFGYCEVPRHKFSSMTQAVVSQSKIVNVVVLHVVVLTFFYLINIPMPFIGLNQTPTLAANAAHIYGIAPINVFNKTDLKMAENWFTLDSVNFDERVPLLTSQGSRLYMHKSDRIYFGYTLGFRRGAIGTAMCQFDDWRDKLKYLSRVYLHLKGAPKGQYSFTYTQLYQPIPNYDLLLKNTFKKESAVVKCTNDYTIKYRG